MPSKISFVDNAGVYPLAHYNMIKAIRDFCGGFGVLGTITFTGTGNGTIGAVEASPTSVTETWTLTATSATNFSVSGSVSGAQADATVGTPYSIARLAFTITAGGVAFVAGDVFSIPVTQGAASAAGIAYEILRYTTVDAEASGHELIMRAPGLDGLGQIYFGFRTYHLVSGDYYNLLAGVFTGYVAGNTFDTQPGARLSGVPAHNNRIDYWMTMNGQRLVLAMKVGTPVFESCYVGKFLPYARPSQYPYPVVCGGMLTGAAASRFSETTHEFPFSGNNARMGVLSNLGWSNPFCYPWGNQFIAGVGTPSETILQMRDTTDQYHLIPIELHDNVTNIWGTLDGVFYISGFNNAVENTLTIGGINYVVVQNVARTSHIDYIAMRLDA